MNDQIRITLVRRLVVLALLVSACASGPAAVVAPSGMQPQFPSPMAETVRTHDRIVERALTGRSVEIAAVLPRPVEVFVPEVLVGRDSVDVFIHFHGAAYLVRDAAVKAGREMVGVTVYLGSGSSVYERPFTDSTAFPTLVDSIRAIVAPSAIRHLVLTSWSAGYGATRAILRNHESEVDGILLLDGLHTDYEPEGVRMADGGVLRSDKMEPFRRFAERASNGEARMVVTHSEIFPGTYASTTETAEWLADALGLRRRAALDWGPGGMQTISEARAGHLAILGFAGNTGPDHVDHVHGLSSFLDLLIAD